VREVAVEERAAGRMWSVQDLSDFLQVPVKTLYQWRLSGYGPKGRRVGKYVRYKESDVVEWVDSLGGNAA
jgi:predicted DNA-binding transcriptional regulator AlpA